MSSSHAWSDVGSKLEALGLKLKLHYEQERVDSDESRDALGKLADAIDGAFDALSAASHDDAVKADLRDAGQALSNALSASFAEISGSLRKAFNEGRSEGSSPGDEQQPS